MLASVVDPDSTDTGVGTRVESSSGFVISCKPAVSNGFVISCKPAFSKASASFFASLAFFSLRPRSGGRLLTTAA